MNISAAKLIDQHNSTNKHPNFNPARASYGLYTDWGYRMGTIRKYMAGWIFTTANPNVKGNGKKYRSSLAKAVPANFTGYVMMGNDKIGRISKGRVLALLTRFASLPTP